jgi:Flp pilus assembly protein TadG
MKKSRQKRCRGGSAMEMAMMLPWYLFFFMGAFDWGFYSHALISVESAARVVAMYTSSSASTTATTTTNTTTACNYALEELRITANVGNAVTTCTASPVVVTYAAVTGADGQPASQVSVTYTTLNLIPIPGLLKSQATFYRVVQMRLRG